VKRGEGRGERGEGKGKGNWGDWERDFRGDDDGCTGFLGGRGGGCWVSR